MTVVSVCTGPDTRVRCEQEHVSDDLEVMRKEYEQWRDERLKRNDVRSAAWLCVSAVLPLTLLTSSWVLLLRLWWHR